MVAVSDQAGHLARGEVEHAVARGGVDVETGGAGDYLWVEGAAVVEEAGRCIVFELLCVDVGVDVGHVCGRSFASCCGWIVA